MAVYCELCGKKVGIFDGFQTCADVLMCTECWSTYSDILNSTSIREFDEKLDEFKNTFLGKEGLEKIVEQLIANPEYLEKVRFKEEEREREKEEELARKERIRQEYNRKLDHLREMSLEGYYEYKVISLDDSDAGGICTSTLEQTLNQLGLDGWHLRCEYTNEFGQNRSSIGAGGVSVGTNSTIDQNILILERFVRIAKSGF